MTRVQQLTLWLLVFTSLAQGLGNFMESHERQKLERRIAALEARNHATADNVMSGNWTEYNGAKKITPAGIFLCAAVGCILIAGGVLLWKIWRDDTDGAKQ